MPVSDDTGFFMPNLFDFVWLLRDSPESLAAAGLFEFRSEKSNEIKHKKARIICGQKGEAQWQETEHTVAVRVQALDARKSRWQIS